MQAHIAILPTSIYIYCITRESENRADEITGELSSFNYEAGDQLYLVGLVVAMNLYRNLPELNCLCWVLLSARMSPNDPMG